MPDYQHEPEGLGSVRFAGLLRRRRWLILICLVVMPAAALGLSLAQEKQYAASAKLLFRDPQFDQQLFGGNSNPTNAPAADPKRQAATNLDLVTLQTVSDRTAKRIHRGLD